MKILQASFFWKNDTPGGLGLTLREPEFTPDELTRMFSGENITRYFCDSDAELGSGLVVSYLAQLAAISAEAKEKQLSLQKVMLAALNIMYLADRGFIPNDEFNGPLIVYERSRS